MNRRRPGSSGIVVGMKHAVPFGLLFVLGCAVGGAASQLAVAPSRAGNPPSRWEYLCTQASPTPSSLTTHLNQMAGQGWDLVSTSPAHLEREAGAGAATDAFVFCFRRAV